jgi:hypothetical protein
MYDYVICLDSTTMSRPLSLINVLIAYHKCV